MYKIERSASYDLRRGRRVPWGIVLTPPTEKGLVCWLVGADNVESPAVQVPRLSVIRLPFFSRTAVAEVLLSVGAVVDLRPLTLPAKGGWAPAPPSLEGFTSFLGEGPDARPNGVMLCVVAESCEREYVCGSEVSSWMTVSALEFSVLHTHTRMHVRTHTHTLSMHLSTLHTKVKANQEQS